MEARAEAKTSCEVAADANVSVAGGALSSELAAAVEELENSRKALLEWETRAGHLQTALAEKVSLSGRKRGVYRQGTPRAEKHVFVVALRRRSARVLHEMCAARLL